MKSVKMWEWDQMPQHRAYPEWWHGPKSYTTEISVNVYTTNPHKCSSSNGWASLPNAQQTLVGVSGLNQINGGSAIARWALIGISGVGEGNFDTGPPVARLPEWQKKMILHLFLH